MKRLAVAFGLLVIVSGCQRRETVTSSETVTTSGTETTGTTSTTSTGSSGGTVSALNTDDKKFFTAASQGAMAEVRLGQIALEKAASKSVRDFGQRMVADHGKGEQELKDLALRKGLALPAVLSKEQSDLVAKLSKLSGKEFERAYMQAMVEDHDQDVAEFQRASTGVQDPDLREWVNKTLPILQQHLQMAKTVKV